MAIDREDIVGGERRSDFAAWFLAEHAIMRGGVKKLRCGPVAWPYARDQSRALTRYSIINHKLPTEAEWGGGPTLVNRVVQSHVANQIQGPSVTVGLVGVRMIGVYDLIRFFI